MAQAVYEISREGPVTRIEFLQSPERDDLLALISDLAELEDSQLRLYVFLQTELLATTADMRAAAGVAREGNRQPDRVAIVAPGNVTYTITRVFKVFRESEITTLAIFRDLEEARAWLVSDAPPPDS
ncbi:MAG: hypothetical protein AAGI24_06995 [Pseudomonadota bacterium]